jgi:hypothetical protein
VPCGTSCGRNEELFRSASEALNGIVEHRSIPVPRTNASIELLESKFERVFSYSSGSLITASSHKVVLQVGTHVSEELAASILNIEIELQYEECHILECYVVWFL